MTSAAQYNYEGHSPERSERIPVELQAVFLASNRGEEVHTPPPNSIAFRYFSRRRVFWGGLLRKRMWTPVANAKKVVRRASGNFPPPPPSPFTASVSAK